MTNFEFYEDEIKSRGFNFAVDKSNGELFCCFILAAAYVATLMLMIYLFIR